MFDACGRYVLFTCSLMLFYVQARRRAVIAARGRVGRPMLLSRHQAGLAAGVKFSDTLRPATASLSFDTGPALEVS